jgi:hypothetical protein
MRLNRHLWIVDYFLTHKELQGLTVDFEKMRALNDSN